eukprot:symbB.v1.2.025073.t2/scaffold2414.1/size128436/1
MAELQVITGQNSEVDFPCSIVWVPIPVVSHVFPIIGHTMITDSKGNFYDFAGFLPGSGRSGVCRNVGIFGPPVKAAQEEFEDDWDEALVHMGCVNNCHSHVVFTLNRLRCAALPRWLHWNSVVLALAMLLLGKFIPGRGGCFRLWYILWPLLAFWMFLRSVGMMAVLHQRLQKLGCNVGPVMVEIKSKPTPVSASPGPSSGPERLGGTLSAATLGGVAALMTGAGVAGATGSFPM